MPSGLGTKPLRAAPAPLQPTSEPSLTLCPLPGCLSARPNQMPLCRIPLDAGAHSASGLLTKQQNSRGQPSWPPFLPPMIRGRSLQRD